MGRRRSPSLFLRGGIWHIDKRVEGYGRLCQSTGTGILEEAERFLARKLEELRQAAVYGVRPVRTFREAATRYLEEFMHKRAIGRDAQDLKLIDPYIGTLRLNQVHMGVLQPFIDARKAQGRAEGTINRTLAVVRQVLNLSAKLWRDEHGLTWLETAPMVQLLDNRNKRKPYPLMLAEQDLLFGFLPQHLREMAEFSVNTGCRESEVCRLQWNWEVPIPELGTSVFVIPEHVAKNGKERVVVLNRIAKMVVDRQRGKHPHDVFTFKDEGVTKIYNSAWKRARKDAAERYAERIGRGCPPGFSNIRVHDLRHTFGRRLRAMDVSLEDRQDLLGHESGRVTTHYSAAEVKNLLESANRICTDLLRKTPAVTFLRISERLVSA